jgi:hypothetical protein
MVLELAQSPRMMRKVAFGLAICVLHRPYFHNKASAMQGGRKRRCKGPKGPSTWANCMQASGGARLPNLWYFSQISAATLWFQYISDANICLSSVDCSDEMTASWRRFARGCLKRGYRKLSMHVGRQRMTRESHDKETVHRRSILHSRLP